MSEIIFPDFDVNFQTDDLICVYCHEKVKGLIGHDQENFVPGSIVFCSLCGGCNEVDSTKKLQQLSLDSFDELSNDPSFVILEESLRNILGKNLLPHCLNLKRTIL